MGLKEDIYKKATEYLSGDYEIEDVDHIPTVEKVAFGKKVKKAKVCVFSIDLRRSTDLLEVHHKQTAGKIHKAFLHTVAATVIHFGGEIRGFKGDSLLALWPANYKSEISRCVQAAMTVKGFLTVDLAEEFGQYSPIDFGIGVDWGEVLIARAGIPRNANNNDLLFLGKCINFAVAIGEQAHGPDHVEISASAYENLEDDTIYAGEEKDWAGNRVNMWKNGAMKWQGSNIGTRLTNYYWRVA